MLCQHCHQQEATIHIQEIVGKQRRALHLCAACAAGKGITAEAGAKGLDLATLLMHLAAKKNAAAAPAKAAEADAEETKAPPAEPACPVCGLTAELFREHGRLGCPACYDAFRDMLSPLFRTLHRGLVHAGKKPGSAAPWKQHLELFRLQGELDRAVAAEDYETAAALRDRIQALRQPPAPAEKTRRRRNTPPATP